MFYTVLSFSELLYWRCPVLARIMRDMILCRPSVNVLMELTDLLFSLGKYHSVMATLCHGTGKQFPALLFWFIPLCFSVSSTNENVPSITTLQCHIIQRYMLWFTWSIIRCFLLQQFKNIGTFKHEIILLGDLTKFGCLLK